MQVGPLSVSGPWLLVAALATAVGLTLVVAGATGGSAFDPYNPEWEGLSEFRGEADGLETRVATAVDAYDDAGNGTVAVLVRPPDYTAAERDRLRSFVERGGTLVVAAQDPERANPILAGVGADIRVDGALLRDEQAFWVTPDFPTVTTVADHPYVRNASRLSLNHGTALSVGADARPLANSSPVSYLARNDTDTGDSNVTAARPVVALDAVGRGEVVAVSDASVFVNAMLDRPDNRALAAALLAEHERLLLDRTASGVPTLVAAQRTLRDSTALSGLLVLAGVGTLAAWEVGLLGRVLARFRRRFDPSRRESRR